MAVAKSSSINEDLPRTLFASGVTFYHSVLYLNDEIKFKVV